MFYPAKMCKVRLIESKASLRKTIGLLEKFGGAEVKRFEYAEVQNAKALEEGQGLNERLVRVEAILGMLLAHNSTGNGAGQKRNGNGNGAVRRMGRKETAAFLNSPEARKAEEKIISIGAEKERLQAEIDGLKDDRAQVRRFSSFNMDFSALGSGTLEVVAGIVQGSNRQRFERCLKDPAILRHTSKEQAKGVMHLVAIRKGDEEALKKLAKAGFERAPMPRIQGKPDRELERIEARMGQLAREIVGLDRELGKICRDCHSKFAAAKEHLKIEAEKAAIPTNFGETGHTVVVEAYLPEKNYAAFENMAKEELGEGIYMRRFSSEQLEERHEQAPTLLEHGTLLEPFEFMTRFVSLPRSNELDPTLIFLVFFPIFYAMMVGDFVYGIISFLIARWLMKKFRPGGIMNPVAKIWMWSAIPTIIFGIIYDEYAGMPHKEMLGKLGFGAVELYRGIERLHNVELLLTVCIMIGIVTMGIGFLLGFVNARKHGNNRHALGKLGWFGVLCSGTTLLSSALFTVLPNEYAKPSAAVFVLSLAAIVKAEGVVGVIELPSLLSNVLSFARIIAVGLVGTVIALILNGMAYPSPDKGILLIVLIPLYVLGHLFNAGMAMFESFIQGARLNYVEFYSKFFEGGGKEFAPFRFERKYLKD